MDAIDYDKENPDEQVVALEEVCEDLGQSSDDVKNFTQTGEVLGYGSDINKNQSNDGDGNNVDPQAIDAKDHGEENPDEQGEAHENRREDLGQTSKDAEIVLQVGEVLGYPVHSCCVCKIQTVDALEQIPHSSTQLSQIPYEKLLTQYSSEHWKLFELSMKNDVTDEDRHFFYLIGMEIQRRKSHKKNLREKYEEQELLLCHETVSETESSNDSSERLLPKCSTNKAAEEEEQASGVHSPQVDATGQAARAADVVAKAEDEGYGKNKLDTIYE